MRLVHSPRLFRACPPSTNDENLMRFHVQQPAPHGRNSLRTLVFILATAFVFYSGLQSASFLFQRQEIAQKKTITMSNPFPEKIVHIDMKGAPLRPEAYERFFPLVKELGAFGLLMEYEDMFPYTGVLESIRRKNAYSDADIRRIVEMAALNGLEVIPLVQTFGHLEFVLKQPMFQKLSENATETNTICISNDNSFEIIRQMLKQIRSLHPESRRIHIGADEAYHVAEEEKCLQRLHSNFHGDTEEMGVAHIARVSKLAHEFGFETVFAWNDMFQHAHPHLLMKYGLGSLIVPVVWGYRESVTEPGYFPLGLFERLSLVFESVYFATAFKGAIDASNQFVSVRRYLHTHYSYVELLRNDAKPVSGIMGGVFITGWSRYAHNLPLCELLPSSLPSLLADLIYLQDVNQTIEEVERKLQGRLNCSVKLLENFSAPKDFAGLQYIMPIESAYAQCDFLWTDVFRLVEDLRFLTWRSKNAWQIGEQLRAKLRKEVEYLTNEANSTLSKLFFDDTVEEFVIQNIQSLFKIIDEPPENELSF